MFDDIINTEKTFDRETKALIYVIKTLNEFCDIGIMEGRAFELTDKAFEIIKDFEPTKEEIEEAMAKLKVGGYI